MLQAVDFGGPEEALSFADSIDEMLHVDSVTPEQANEAPRAIGTQLNCGGASQLRLFIRLSESPLFVDL